MNTNNETNTNQSAAPRSKRRWAVAALAVAAGAVLTGVAFGGQAMHGHRGHMPMSPAAMDAHINQMIEQCAADASADQKTRLSAIAQAAMADVRAAHEQLDQGHTRAHELLTAAVIDRGALEQVRAEQMQRMDFISRRVLAAAEDGAELLTPAQRASCGQQMGKLMH